VIDTKADGGKWSTRKVADTEIGRPGKWSISGAVRLGFVGQLSCRSLSVSITFRVDHFPGRSRKLSDKTQSNLTAPEIDHFPGRPLSVSTTFRVDHFPSSALCAVSQNLLEFWKRTWKYLGRLRPHFFLCHVYCNPFPLKKYLALSKKKRGWNKKDASHYKANTWRAFPTNTCI